MTVEPDTSDANLARVEPAVSEIIIEPTQPLSRPVMPQRTLADVLAEVILRGRSEQTRRAYRSDLQDFLVYLGHNVTLPDDPELLQRPSTLVSEIQSALSRIQQVSEADISAYIRHLSKGLKPATISRRLTPLRLLYSRLLRYHAIALNPMEEIKKPKVSQRSNTIYLSRQEARTLEEECKGPTLRDLRDHALMVLMLSTGLRSSEVLGITFGDLAEMDGHRVVWITGKGNQRDRVKLKPRTWQVLDRYLKALREEQIDSGAVFRRLRHKGRDPEQPDAPRRYAIHGPLTYDGLKYILQTRFTQAKLHLKLEQGGDSDMDAAGKTNTAEYARRTKVTPHGLRHSFVTLALKGGAPLSKVQAAARHSDPKTTMRYAHDQDELDDNAVDYVNW
ncbi:MAG: tyrosine-type recombinase/integrase [Chloroflexi bacterium]|nr:tyrosine-type recombinase/integrase [Chloroflexota bacterium]